jgi:hypothetical protein
MSLWDSVLAKRQAIREKNLYRQFPHLIWTNDGASPEMIEWCTEQFGPVLYPSHRSTYCNRWIDAGDAFYFSDENDAFAFKMRWG